MMTLQEVIDRLITIRDAGTPNVNGKSPVVVECTMEDELYQSGKLDIAAEARCEDDDEPIAVYITPVWEDGS